MFDMTPSNKPANHPKVAFGKTGVLMINLGTPSGTDYWSMRRYLSEFLSDKRVIEYPRAIWQPILQLMILTKRPFTAGQAYRSIWMEEADESPLAYYTRETATGMTERFGDQLVFDYAMRYGDPAIEDRLIAMKDAGCDRILILPLYPQYSAATTGTVVDKVCDTLKKMRWQPAIRVVPSFHDHPVYIREIAAGILDTAARLTHKPDRVLLSFHGVPQSYLKKGDPYHCFCQVTARLVGQELSQHGLETEISFQSRFGPEEWLQPYSADRFKEMPGEGVKHLLVASPGFVADCVETLEEIADEGREDFMEAGGESFTFSPCLNISENAFRLYGEIIKTELAGWVDVHTEQRTPVLQVV